MEFVELTEKQFDSVCNNFKESSFYQTSAWARVKKLTGWIHYYVGVKENNKIIACSLVLGNNIYLNKYIYYAPRGLLVDYNNLELLDFFINKLKKFLIKRNGIFLKIDPLIDYKWHDRYGNPINEKNNQFIVDHLTELGFKHHGFTTGYSDEIQFRWSFCVNVDRSMEEIVKEMDQRCRRCIRKYESYPLKIVPVDDKNMKDFKNIMEHTAKRHNHFDRTTEYYKKIAEELKDDVRMSIIYLDKQKFLENHKEDKLYSMIAKQTVKYIPISAGVFIFDSNRANYVYGGTYKEYMPLMAQYKMQMEMIKETMKKGIPIYDFGGISGDFDSTHSNYGVYEFKRGFGGNVIEYIGEFDLMLNKKEYLFYTKMYKLYKKIKSSIAKV